MTVSQERQANGSDAWHCRSNHRIREIETDELRADPGLPAIGFLLRQSVEPPAGRPRRVLSHQATQE
jgi:hypothetical protein